MRGKMELLSPAGSYASLLAAVNNGADAVYLGGQRFHARQREVGFTAEELLKSLEYAHQRGCKVYVTLNILLDSAEVEEALEDAYDLYTMGVDALIVQDIGLMQLLHEVLPQMRLHASTQATVYNADGLRFMQSLGVKRTVLARELSLLEIEQMHREIPDMELEVFAHGALCYSYSGQCLFSSMAGGRSGNRGRCAQPCRKPYRLLSQMHPEGILLPPHSRYLLSTADQCLLEALPQLYKAGVESLKIEGRLKKPEYVAMVTRCYREVLDHLPDVLPKSRLNQMEKDMKGMFNRDFTQDYLTGRKGVLRIDKPDNRGILIGHVEARKGGRIQIHLQEEVRQNDGILLKDRPGEEISLTLRQLEVQGRKVSQALAGERLTLSLRENVLVGEPVYKTRDSLLYARIQDSLKEKNLAEANRIPLYVELEAKIGEPLKLFARDAHGRKAEITSETVVSKAQKQPLQIEKVQEKLARLGNTPFILQEFQAQIEPNAMFPFSELNQLRRELVEQLEQQDPQLPRLEERFFLAQKDAFYQKLYGLNPEKLFTADRKSPLLSVHAGNIPAAEMAVQLGADRVILDIEPFTPIRHRPEQIQTLIQMALESGKELILALPRIHRGDAAEKNLENWVVNYPDVPFLLENWGDVSWAEKHKVRFATDYALNITNEVSYQKAILCGAESVCLSVEMNAGQMRDFHSLSRAEIVIHGELILMVAEGCTLYHSMPLKKDGSCPHHCVRDRYALLDEKNYQFPLAHDVHCRQYVFNSRTLCLWEELSEILSWKPYALRIEAQRYTAEQMATLIPIYRNYLDHPHTDGERIREEKEKLRLSADSAFTRGHFTRGVL